MDGLKGVVGKNCRPDRVFWIGTVRHDPEALVWMMDECDDFSLGGCDGPGAPKEVEGIVRV